MIIFGVLSECAEERHSHLADVVVEFVQRSAGGR